MTERELILNSKSDRIIIEARAGTGKTRTLIELTEKRPRESFLYLSYNNSLKKEGKRKFGGNVEVHTIHSLAYKEIGFLYKNKLGEANIKNIIKHTSLSKSKDVIEFIWLQAMEVLNVLNEYFKGGSEPDNKIFKEYWDSMCELKDGAPMSHDGYLKLFHISKPNLRYDWILLDEGQDADKIALDIILRQKCKIVIVGDTYQEIYGFRGIDNVFLRKDLQDFERFKLTKSWRFGDSISYVANFFLTMRNGFLLEGQRESDLLMYDDGNLKDTIICRTNAHLLDLAFQAVNQNKKIHIIGGMQTFNDIEDVYYLYTGELYKIRNHHIKSFKSFVKLKEFAEKYDDKELTFSVKLIEKFNNVLDVIKAVEFNITKQYLADVVFVTAHKSKGLDFDTVRIATDFPKIKNSLKYEEINLLYVAVTRAKKVLYLPDYIMEKI